MAQAAHILDKDGSKIQIIPVPVDILSIKLRAEERRSFVEQLAKVLFPSHTSIFWYKRDIFSRGDQFTCFGLNGWVVMQDDTRIGGIYFYAD